MNRATSAACGLIAAGIINRDFVREVPKIIGGIIIFMSTLMFGMAIVNFKLLRLITIAVIALIFFIALSLFQVSRETAFIIVILLSVPIGIFFANSHVFSGLVLTILVLTGYCMASFSILKTNGIIMPTFSPAIAITLTFVLFYCYTRIKHYMGKMHMINLASRDGLTGLMNRRYFNAIIDSEFDGIASHRFKKLSLVMCDIDDFKKLNDTFGHQAGDEVLRRVAKVMKSKCRATDIIARYGGEEFVFVFPGAGIEEISGLVEEIRQSVERETFNFKKQMRSVTISMGLAQYFRGMKKEELIEKADQALYRAKKEGKNRVCI
jgi:diguanylate cyclase (GGDEF)-like protein